MLPVDFKPFIARTRPIAGFNIQREDCIQTYQSHFGSSFCFVSLISGKEDISLNNSKEIIWYTTVINAGLFAQVL